MSPETLSSLETQRREVAQILFEASCVDLNFEKGHTFSSGIKSPIKVDCEKLINSPEYFEWVTSRLEEVIRQTFGDYRFFCGIITGGALVAKRLGERFGLPVVNRVGVKQDEERKALEEGEIDPHAKVLVIDDGFTTSENAGIVIRQIRKEGGNPLGLVTIFDYGFTEAHRRLRWDHGLHLWSLTKFNHLLTAGQELNKFKPGEIERLDDWWKTTNKNLLNTAQVVKI